MIYLGTSGYGYHEWSPGFYPSGLCYEEYLKHYARTFSFCELRSTFFFVPPADEVAKLAEKVPADFRFTVKLDRRLTHERDADLRLAHAFAERMRPLVESDKLGAVLAQFPFSFINNPYSRAYLCRLRAALELPLVAELRNDTWVRPETLGFLEGWGIGLAAIDAPVLGRLTPPVALATSRTGYVRFHGRNAESWWKRTDSARYEYRYRHRELLSWAPRIREIGRHATDTYIVFNNHRHGYALANAVSMSKILARSAKRVSQLAKARAG